MARRRKPYTVILVKGSPYWYYKTEEMDQYRPTDIRVQLRAGKPSNKAEAERWAAEQWKQNHPENPSSPMTLEQFLAPYYIPGICPHIGRVLADNGRYSERWAKDQRRRIERYVLPDPIAQFTVQDLRPGHLEDFKQRLRRNKLSVRTINIILSALKTALKEGYHRGDIDHDPTVGVGTLRGKSKETGIFTLEEMRRILQEPSLFAANVRYKGNQKGKSPDDAAYLFFFLCAVTGERPRAILDLRWRDLTEDMLAFERTKTTDGRSIPLVSRAVNLLLQFQEGALRVAPDDFVFSYDDGTPMQKTWYEKRFRHMMERAQFPDTDSEGRRRIPYSLKHSFITHLIDAGVDEVLVREYVGHSHGYGISRILTPAQSRYRHRQLDRLRDILPKIEEMYEI